jgi:hypothetical protein
MALLDGLPIPLKYLVMSLTSNLAKFSSWEQKNTFEYKLYIVFSPSLFP